MQPTGPRRGPIILWYHSDVAIHVPRAAIGGEPSCRAPRPSGEEHVADEMESFALLAELALGLAGFGGVAAAFGGRERSFRPTELIRLQGLFVDSSFILVGCGLVGGLGATSMTPATLYFTASAVVTLLVAGVSLPLLVRSFRYARDPESTSEPWAVFVSLASMAGSSALLVGNMILGAVAWPLVVSFWIFLIHGLWMFYRVLTRPN